MDRKLASIVTVKNLRPIEGADKIEVCEVLGWSCVVKKNEYKIGDKVIYVECDAVMPDRPEYEFLRSKKFRIKIIRLRKQISMGLILPLSSIPADKNIPLDEGTDVSEALGIVKWEPVIPPQLAGKIKGNFPQFLIKTDETRIQSVPQVLERHKGKVFWMTEKVDGTSMTCYLKDDVFGICSRNLDLAETEDNVYWQYARKNELEEKLKIGRATLGNNIAIQGELCGPGIQGNKLHLAGLQLFVFNIFNIDNYKYVNYGEMLSLSALMNLFTVPFSRRIVLDHTVEQLVEIVSNLKSLAAPPTHSVIPEGVVFRPLVEDRDEDLGRLSFKIINPNFLLLHDD